MTQSVRHLLLAAIVAILVQGAAAQSQVQTLPQGFLSTDGTAGTAFPFNIANDQVWQWHYNQSNFLATGPILINQIYIRASSPSAATAAFSCAELEITLIESPEHPALADPVFDDNSQRSEICRPASAFTARAFPVSGGTVGTWISLQMSKSFLYDPSSGNHLIIQLRVCGMTTTIGTTIDGAHAECSRQGHSFDCNATTRNTSSSTFAPIVRIDYTEVSEQTLPQGFLSTDGSATTTALRGSNDSTWQWHYDSSEFVAGGPITITEISVRSSHPSATFLAFEYDDLEVTLGEAATHYDVASHDPVFANNFLRSKVVRTGQWKANTTPPVVGSSSATWLSFELTEPFVYDPTSGNDFIVQLRSCNPVTPFATSLDASVGGPGLNGGNSYAHLSSCTASSQTFSNNEAVAIIKIAYLEREITTFPYNENFDRHGATHRSSKMPLGWLADDMNDSDWRCHHSTTSSATASADHSTGIPGLGFYATTDDSLSAVDAERLETPIFDLSALTNPLMTFWVYSDSSVDSEELDENILLFDIKKHTGGNVVLDTNVIDAVHLLTHGCWTKMGIDLSAYANEKISVVFRASTDSDDYSAHDFAIDDVYVGERAPDGLGQPGWTRARLYVNSASTPNGELVNVGVPGPFYAYAKPGGKLNIRILGVFPNQPVAFWIGPLNIGVADFGSNGQMDTGTPDVTGDGIPDSILVLGNAFVPNPTFNDLFYFVGPDKDLELSFELSPFLPPGLLGTFQAAIAAQTLGPSLSNAVVLEIVP